MFLFLKIKIKYFSHLFLKYLFLPLIISIFFFYFTQYSISYIYLIFSLYVVILIPAVFSKYFLKYLDKIDPKLTENYIYKNFKNLKNQIQNSTYSIFKNLSFLNFFCNNLKNYLLSFLLLLLSILFLLHGDEFIMDNMDTNKQLIFLKKYPTPVIENTNITLWFYTTRKDTISLIINNKKIFETTGKEVKYKIKPKSELNIKYKLSNKTIHQKIALNRLPKIKNIDISISPPKYLSRFINNIPDTIVKNSKWNFSAKSTKKVDSIVVKNNKNRIVFHPESKNIDISKTLKNGKFDLFYTYKNKRYLISKYRYDITKDSLPIIKIIKPNGHIYINNRDTIEIKYLVKDDFAVKNSTIYNNGNIIDTININKQTRIVSYNLKVDKKWDKTKLKIKAIDIKNQAAWSDPVTLEKLDEKKVNDYIDKNYKKNIEINEKNYKDMENIESKIKKLDKKIKLKGELNKKQRENIKKIKQDLRNMKKKINKNKELMDNQEKNYIENYLNKEIDKMIKKLDKLLNEVDLRRLKHTSKEIDKKTDSFKNSLKNFIKALQKIKTLQNLENLIEDIKKTESNQKISRKLNEYQDKINHYKNDYKKAKNRYNENKNKKKLLNTLKNIKKRLKSMDFDKIKNTLLDILKVQINFSTSIKGRKYFSLYGVGLNSMANSALECS